MAAERRRDGWAVSYQVDVVFDTNLARTRYDHVGTLARCGCCGERLDGRSADELARHARRHERQLSVDEEDRGHNVSVAGAISGKEVGARPQD